MIVLDVITIYQGDEVHLHFPIQDPEGKPYEIQNEIFEMCIINPTTKEEILDTQVPYDPKVQLPHITLRADLTSQMLGTYVYFIRIKSNEYKQVVTKGKLKVVYAPVFGD